jgi:hypothetical protein
MASQANQFPELDDAPVGAEQEDDFENIAAEQAEAGPEFIGDHMGGNFSQKRQRFRPDNEVTQKVWVPIRTTLRELSGMTEATFPIGELSAKLFQKESTEGGSRTLTGDIAHAHITRVALNRIRYSGHSTIAIAGVKVTNGKLALVPGKTVGSAANGRRYSMIVAAHEDIDYKITKKKEVVLYENYRLLKQDLIRRYSGKSEADILKGVTDIPGDPKHKMFAYKENELLDRLIGLNLDELHELFPEFDYNHLGGQADLGLERIQIPTEVVSYLATLFKRKALDKIEANTDAVKDTAVVFENPMAEDGSFRGLRGSTDPNLDAPITIEMWLKVSAVVHGR